jgi:prenyltransferase beta subunit
VSVRRPLAALATICVVLSICAACPALAAAPDPGFQPNLDATVRYLQLHQNEDGGFGGEPGAKSDPDFSAWVALALAAAGINPRDQTTAKQRYLGGKSVYIYLAEHAGELSPTTDFERELLIVDAAGTSPYDFGGVNLLERILQRQLPKPGPDAGAFVHEAGSTEAGMNDTIFAILALSPIKEPAAQHAVQIAAEWIEKEQDCDYGWPATANRTAGPCTKEGQRSEGEPESEVDMTGAAIEALNAAGRHQAAQATEEHALQYLHHAQDPNGGFPEEPGDHEPNVASTAWVVQAMWSAGINPEDWVTHSGLATEEPLGYLASMQQADGHIRYENSLEENGVWMTAYVTPAFAGDPLPISEVPYEELPPAPTEASTGASAATPPSSVAPGDGQGGESPIAGKGVIAGGGGPGAPLFSRPQPHSQGHTPGGARLLSNRHKRSLLSDERMRRRAAHRSAVKRRRDPGASRTTPVPTTTTAAPKPTTNHNGPGAGAVSTGSGTGAKGPHPPTTGTGNRAEGSSSAHRGTGSGAGETGMGQSLPTPGAAGSYASGKEVKGVLIGAAGPITASGALEPGAPGLHSAGSGGNETRWLTIPIGALIALLILAGSQLERRRPRVTL